MLVALPHLRRGSRILTPKGEQTVLRAKEKSGQAVTAIPAGIASLARGSGTSKTARQQRSVPPALGGHGPVVARPDDTGGLTLTRDITGPIEIPGGDGT